MLFVWILLANLVNSLLGLIGVLTLWIKKGTLDKSLIYFVAFSAGALLGGAFFHLFPESLERLSPMYTFGVAMLGFLLFMLIEGFFHWHLCQKCQAHPFSYIMLIGDSIHNIIDGMVIAASFFINIPLGLTTTLMILFHEAPQELGLFGSLVYAGHNRKNSLVYSLLAQSTCIIGGIIGYFLSSGITVLSPFLVAFAAGGFVYIAASDLVPEMHKAYRGNVIKSLYSIGSLLLGVVFMLGIKFLGG